MLLKLESIYMSETILQGMVDLLARNELRIRTGIVEVPLEVLGHEPDVAVHLGIGCRDICTFKASRIPSTRPHLAIRWQTVLEDLELLVSDLSLPGCCIWVSGVDVLLAAIPFPDRKSFWGYLRSTFRQSRGLLLSIPESAAHLLPADERSEWIKYDRLCTWTRETGVIES